MRRATKTIRLACLWLVLSASGFLLAVEVRGTVRDIYNQPLAGVRVRAGEGGPVFITDADGAFAFTSAEQATHLTLYFDNPQFHGEKRMLFLKDKSTPVNIYLIPVRLLREDVTVTALNSVEKTVAAPMAQNVVSSATVREDQPETVVQAVQKSPGVHFIGKGGITVTPSIRGLARRRVLFLIDGARITSDRSAGASAHFFPPEMIRQVEIARSAQSVIYGSDAIGGVIQVISRSGRDPESGIAALNLSGHSADGKFNGGLALRGKAGAFSWLAAVQVARAGDYASAAGSVLNSGYRYYSASLAMDYETEKRGLRLGFFGAAGRDIGKPERANDRTVASFYPEDNTRLLTLSYRDKGPMANGSLNFSFFIDANDYELDKVKYAEGQTDISRNHAFDFGMRAFLKTAIAHGISCQAGIDYYGRRGVDMKNETWRQGVLRESSFPVAAGRRGDLGLYATLAWSAPAGFELLAGGRLATFYRSALAAGVFRENRSLAPALFLGVTRRIGDVLTLFVNSGTAFRLPSLSEAFYTGITGRSSIVGNPALEPEKSLSIDAGVKVHQRDLFIGAYFFQNSIRAMIEKFPLPGAAYTYANIEQGRIRGLELEFQYYPWKKLEIFGNGFCYRGRSNSGSALNDVPSARLFLGTKLWAGRLWGEMNWLAAAALRRPGPAEVAAAAYAVCDLKAGCYFSNRVILSAKIANVFNRAYYANGDPDMPLAKGIDLSLGLNLNL